MPQQKYPVYIYIHGGGYQTGSGYMGNQGTFENFISTGMIVVSINYRLNVFGRLLSFREVDEGASVGYGNSVMVSARIEILVQNLLLIEFSRQSTPMNQIMMHRLK
jgi:hypothetical protein